MDDFYYMSESGGEISMKVGSKLCVKIPDVQFPLYSIFIGLYQESYLLISPPQPFTKIKHKLFKDQELLIQYVTDGKVFKFQTKIIDYIAKPIRLVVVLFPEVVQELELRSEKRRFCGLPTQVKVGENNYSGIIQDITRIGCSLLCNFKKSSTVFKPDIDISLKFAFVESTNVIEVSGKVRNVRKLFDRILVGIQFTKLGKEAQAELLQYIFKIDGSLAGDLVVEE